MRERRVLVTGGAGFIGSNLAMRLLNEGVSVIIYDNLSRPGTEKNLAWLQQHPGAARLCLVQRDLRDFDSLIEVVSKASEVYHLGGQVAVTTSVADPRGDFEANALGTLNVLEAARLAGNDPVILYASTNKVYGKLDGVPVVEQDTRYVFESLTHGVPEIYPLDFHSPYGCSKGAADQYVRDYARIYHLRTVVLRQSCIYGPRQLGVEDQGWVAWFIIAALKGRPITIYGNGKQVRDVLFVDDLLDAYELAVKHIDSTAGQVYNIGGGPENTMSIWREFGPICEEVLGKPIPVTYADWRPGDQAIYVSDIRKAHREFAWSPRIAVRQGIESLYHWVRSNQDLFGHVW